MNSLKTAFLLTCLTLLLVAMGGAIGGKGGLVAQHAHDARQHQPRAVLHPHRSASQAVYKIFHPLAQAVFQRRIGDQAGGPRTGSKEQPVEAHQALRVLHPGCQLCQGHIDALAQNGCPER